MKSVFKRVLSADFEPKSPPEAHEGGTRVRARHDPKSAEPPQPTKPDWDEPAALAAVRLTMDRLAEVYTGPAGMFDDPHLQATERKIDAAFRAHDLTGLHVALEGYERHARGLMRPS